MPAKDFLLEIGTEPLPARFVAPAAQQLLDGIRGLVDAHGLGTDKTAYRWFGALRRVAVEVTGLSERSPDRSERIKGPPEKLWKDADGRFTPQSEGFARKNNVAPQALKLENGFLWAHLEVPGQKAADLLSKGIPEILRKIEFPKSLEWETTRFRFGRPIRSIAALLGTSVIPVEVAGVRSGKKVAGLAALQRKPVALKKPGDYLDALRRESVLADPKERKAALLERLETAAEKAGKIDLDEELIDETVFMTEQPTPVVGAFSEEYLQLPEQLLSLVLKKQLKFFPVFGPDKRLKAAFVGVRDGLSEGESLVREGYQRVLAARGNDAVFFFKRDLASRLEDKLAALGKITYQKGLGTMEQKGWRVIEVTRWLCEAVRQDRPADERAALEAARLCYADLVTDVVREFPELQGVMGGVYARRDGLDERIALGLEQFYLPVGPKSPVPTTLEGALVSLAGKLDSLAGHFSLGQAPTGSADPFGLRRHALGAIRIALEHQLPLDLGAAVARAVALQPVQADQLKVSRELNEFLWGRAQALLEEKGFRVDEIRSVRQGALTNLKRTYLRLAAIKTIRKIPDFEPLAAAFKRASNILRQAQFSIDQAPSPERAQLREDAELALFDALTAMEGQVHERLVDQNYETGLRTLVGIKPHLDRFFDKVMVMADDQALRAQRLNLLAKVIRLFKSFADLSEIQSPSSN